MNAITESARFRQILGHYPTGVCAITTMQPDGTPAAMIVGSFTSVSLDPLLVAFLPDKGSTSWPKIESAGGFCVNVLADHQEELCRTLASRSPDKFDHVAYHLSARGMPVLDGALAWIDCALYAVYEAGDHYIAVGQVEGIDVHHPGAPLLFYKGAYGRVSPL
ncbi:flavin reductase family protein [Sphingobium sp.]|uniref:flavin reductase family protein n=1 Tax=Sphingobium sp. TaxID=1912891 RepID=UPI003B3AAA74